MHVVAHLTRALYASPQIVRVHVRLRAYDVLSGVHAGEPESGVHVCGLIVQRRLTPVLQRMPEMRLHADRD